MARPVLLEQLSWSTIGAVAQFAGQVAFTALLLACLGDEGTADTLSILWIGLLVAIGGGFGLPEAGTRFVAVLQAHGRLDQAAALEWRLATIHLMTTSVLALASAGVAWVFGRQDLALLIGCCVVAAAAESRGVARAHGRGTFRSLALARLVFHAVRAGGLLVLIRTGGGIIEVAWLILASALVYPLLVRPFRGLRPQPPRRAVVRFAYRYALGIWGASVIATLAWTRVELLVLELRSTAQQTVVFGIALSLAGIVLFVPGVISAPLLPYVAGRRRRSIAELRRVYHLALGVGLYASMLVLAVVVAFAPWFLVQAYGPGYADARVPTYLVGLAALGGIGGIVSSVLHAHGRSHTHAAITLVAAVVLLVAAWYVAPRGGAEAISWLRVGVFMSYTAILAIYVALRLDLGFPLRSLAVLVLVSLVIGGGLLWWQAARPSTSLATAVIQAMLAVAGMVGLGWWLRPLDAAAGATVLEIGGRSPVARMAARMVSGFSARRR